MTPYILLLVGTEAMLIMALLAVLYFVRRHRAQLKNHEHIQQLKIEHQESMISELVYSTEKERKRIAQEIHDDVGQSLLLLRLKLNELHSTSALKELVDTILTSLRNIAYDLYPSGLASFGLTHELEHLFDLAQDRGINVKDEYHGTLHTNSDQELAIYRVVQELISNTIKHSKAESIEFSIESVENELQLKYADNGIGMDVSDSSRGMGMLNIESRFSAIQAESNVITTPGQGFKLIARLSTPTTAQKNITLA